MLDTIVGSCPALMEWPSTRITLDCEAGTWMLWLAMVITKGSSAGAGSSCESVLCDPLSPPASFTGFGARTPRPLSAVESLLDESFPDAGSFELPLGGLFPGGLAGAGLFEGGVGVGVSFGAWDAGAATATTAVAGAPVFRVVQVAQDPKISPEVEHGEGRVGEDHTSQSVDHTWPKLDPLVLVPVELEGVDSSV